VSTPSEPSGRDADERAAELDEPRPAPPAHEPGKGTGATASERASAQTAAELSDR
jgi:hypothetical protein